MRVAVIGGGGTLGSAVRRRFERAGHEVVAIGRTSDPSLDLADGDGFHRFFEAIGPLDGVVSAAASVPLRELRGIDAATLRDLMAAKFQGQMLLAAIAAEHLPPHGWVTLTGGAIPPDIPAGAAFGAAANAGLDAFVTTAAGELAPVRINLVKPGWISETLAQLGMDPTNGTPADVVATAFVELAQGSATGTVVRPA